MLFSFELLTRPLDRDTTFYIVDTDRVIAFTAVKSRSRHVYNNVPVSGIPSVTFPGDHQMIVNSYGSEAYINREQRDANLKLEKHQNVNFQYRISGTPTRAVITFPHTKGPGGWELPYGVLDAQKFEITDALFISFQDPYLTSGSYFLTDNYGDDPVPAVLRVIRALLEKFGLSESDSTLIGSSKGAASAAIVSRHLRGNQLVVVNYSTDLHYKLHATEWSHIGAALDFLNIRIPDTLKILLQESEEKEVHWFYSKKGDFSSNMDNEYIEAPNLKKWSCEETHGKILSSHFDQIAKIIDEFSSENSICSPDEVGDSFIFNSIQHPSIQLERELLRRGMDKETISEIPFSLDISACSRLDNLFHGFSSLRTCPNLDTGHIVRMDNMFAGCTSLLTVPPLETGSVVNMNYMFRGCSSLKLAPSIDTSNVKNMVGMFSGCQSLIKVEGLQTRSTWSLEYLFKGCRSLIEVPELDLSRVTRLNFAFFGCTSLENVKLKNAERVSQMKYAFGNCSNLKHIGELGLPSLMTADGIFYNCESLGADGIALHVSQKNVNLLKYQSCFSSMSQLANVPVFQAY